jgi:isoleucyl-tRNA synthetase
VVDKDGKKMSKSLGNVISPKQIVDTMGADILRLWVASADYRNEITISDEILKRVADGYRRIRNTARFLIGNLSEFDEKAELLKFEECTLIDRWAIELAEKLQNEILEDYQNYQFHQIYQKFHHFCSQEMGAFYLDILKDRLYTAKKGSKARTSAQTAMHHILQAMIRWMAPIMTFTADEIWKLLGNKDNVLFEEWYQFPEFKQAENWDQKNWDIIQEIRDANSKLLEELRIKGEIGSSLDASVKLYLDESLYEQLYTLNNELKFILITSEAEILPMTEKPDDAVICQLDEVKVAIKVTVAKGEKCVRCWHKTVEVGKIPEHPEICGRCVENIEGNGEVRVFA